MVKPTSVRATTASQEYFSAKQRQNQKVQAFVAYLDELEGQLDEISEPIKTQRLLHGLLPDLRQRILGRETVPEGRNELIAIAQRLEAALEQEHPHRGGDAAGGRKPSNRGKSRGRN